jgi:Xaa-Pro aminopeptidase
MSGDDIAPEGQPNNHDSNNYDAPMADSLKESIARDWDPAPPMPHSAQPDVAPYTRLRRAALSAHYPGRLVVVPAGSLKVRANDTQYGFRAETAFTWLTGETEADAVLVLRPDGAGHTATLYVAEYAQPGELGYFSSRSHGGVWVGNVPSVSATGRVLAIDARPRAALRDDLAGYSDTDAVVLSGIDPDVESLLPRGSEGDLAQVLDELRLVKDDWEIARLQHACDITARGFADVVREIPRVLDRPVRGERWLEGTFWRRARLEGNEVGYGSIVGSGAHATTLHWWRNHGALQSGQLLLADMGVETDALYTADVTRTMPLNGEWTPVQRRVYDAVREAQDAGIAEVKAGADFLAANRAAQWVLADHLHSWGVLPVPADVSCSADLQRPGAELHRRYTLHGVSHMLGIDVHDCARARDETYRDGTLAAGHVLTVEPGLYFQVNDRTVPAELRGIGVRIEDDIVVTDGAPVNLSASLPRDPDEIVAWMREVQASQPEL